MNINIGKLIKKYKIILYLVIIIGFLFIFKHISKNNNIEGYQNSAFAYNKPKSYSNPNGDLVWTGYKICMDEVGNVELKKLNESCSSGYTEQKKINYGWVSKNSKTWNKILWEYNTYKKHNFLFLERFKEAFSKQNNTKWLSIINDDKFDNDENNKTKSLKQLGQEYTRITTIWETPLFDTNKRSDDYAYHEKLWNTYPKQPRNMSPHDLLDKFIYGDINEESKIIRIGYKDSKGKIIKNNYDQYYPLSNFKKQYDNDNSDITTLYGWIKNKITNYRHHHESEYFWYRNGNSNWNGPYDKFDLLKHYQSGKFNDKSFIVRSTAWIEHLNKVDESNAVQFYELGENLAFKDNNNRKSLNAADNPWDGKVGVKTKNGNTTTSTDLYDWIQKNKSTKEDGSWPSHRKPAKTSSNPKFTATFSKLGKVLNLWLSPKKYIFLFLLSFRKL